MNTLIPTDEFESALPNPENISLDSDRIWVPGITDLGVPRLDHSVQNPAWLMIIVGLDHPIVWTYHGIWMNTGGLKVGFSGFLVVFPWFFQ